MDDILDSLDSNEKPFKEETPKQQTTNTNDFKSIADDEDLKGIAVDATTLKSVGKFFTIATHGEIPKETVEALQKISISLLSKGFFFRYDGDSKKDFYDKILDADLSKVEMYLPWKKFNTNFTAKMVKPAKEAFEHAAYYHKGYKKIPPVARTMTARTVHTILGENCKNPVKFMLCYSEDGAETTKTKDFAKTGFIGFNIDVCDMLDIPVFNLGKSDAIKRLADYISTM